MEDMQIPVTALEAAQIAADLMDPTNEWVDERKQPVPQHQRTKMAEQLMDKAKRNGLVLM